MRAGSFDGTLSDDGNKTGQIKLCNTFFHVKEDSLTWKTVLQWETVKEDQAEAV